MDPTGLKAMLAERLTDAIEHEDWKFPKTTNHFGYHGEKFTLDSFNRDKLWWVGTDRPLPGLKISMLDKIVPLEAFRAKVDARDSWQEEKARADWHDWTCKKYRSKTDASIGVEPGTKRQRTENKPYNPAVENAQPQRKVGTAPSALKAKKSK